MSISPDLHRFHSPLFTSVVKDALLFFLNTPLQSLPLEARFEGVGVYAIYLLHHDGIYQKIADPLSKRPIYVGKAVAAGWRTARISDLTHSFALFGRLREHAGSIIQTDNLDIKHFQSRFMILNHIESDLIVPVEAELIRHYKPLWNTTIDGFGNHDPGSGRYSQALSEWDTLHPGRSWTSRVNGAKPDIERVLKKVSNYSDNLESSD